MSKSVLHHATNLMRSTKMRVTAQRVAVIEYLLKSKDHPTADDIYQALEHKFPSISPATIYNNLRVLCDMGLVREMSYSNMPSRFDGNTTDHYHIICDDCGQIIDFHYPILEEVEVAAEQLTSFKISHHRLEIYGKCKECQALAATNDFLDM